MARYEEERYGGQRGSTRRGGFERGSVGGGRGDEDDFEQQERDRYRSSEYGRDYGESERSRGAAEGSWRDRERDYGRSLGSRGYERYDEEETYGSSYGAGGREGSRYAAQSERYQGRSAGQRSNPYTRDFNPSQGFGFSPEPDESAQEYGQSSRVYGAGRSSNYDESTQRGQGNWGTRGSQSWQGGQRYYQGGRGVAGGGGGMQADGWSGEPDEMRWGRQQGLYGSSEYGGYISSQRSQADYQSNVGKGPKNWQRSDERIREEVCEVLARHPEIDASDVEIRVQGGEVTLTGTVTDRRARRVAEDVTEDVFGVKDVTNQIKVNKAATTRVGERDVITTPDREGRITSEAAEKESRRTGVGTTAGTTAR